jgi:hypothetical protein
LKVSQETLSRFDSLRRKVFIEIQKRLEEDGHCKHYEGTFGFVFPGYFDDEYAITLDLYVFGPNRHYCWSGKSLEDALNRAEKEITQWMEESE